MDARLCFNLRPPDGKINGVFVNANSPGIAPFTFHAQHGSMKSTVTEESVTGFDACTKHADVQVKNARDWAEPPKLETHGFELLNDGKSYDEGYTAHDFLREDITTHYPTAIELAKKLFPTATAAYAFNHVRRMSRQTAELSKKQRHNSSSGLSAPSYMVHADSTAESWLHKVKQLVSDGEFEAIASTQLSAEQGEVLAKAKRIVVINLWRLVTNFHQPSPTHLALCDMRSVDLEKHAIPYHFLVDGCVGYNYGLDEAHAKEYEWGYFPKLGPDEIVVFKAYDSADGGKWCFHAACDDPGAPDGCPPRESVEVRVALAFGEE